ncbi:sn-glycerol-1-phosphate dehydrogenase [Xylanivirga thermophila]|uniref:sn-glycerol-1-phosphate dehydrogenase n=1 Tax=Xylanivirga thermophila TaxID=2496273 RepID=UPI00101D0F1A|nr:sn-glycerol-1-phosphate dehydrogenase [Xylanivirga thermophila]
MQITVDDIQKFGINDFLGKDFECKCGKIHSVKLDNLIIEEGAIEKLPMVLKNFGYKNVFLVADNNTYDAAGREVEKILISAGFSIEKLIYERAYELVPDEVAIGEFLVSYNKKMEVILTVGSGVLNDISKYMSFMLDIPSIVVATAPSMDGYASSISALMLKDTKISVQSTPPKAIIGDIDILRKAPMDMILAGFGDMLGKYSALRDWKLANIVIGEYYCDVVKNMIELSVNRCAAEVNLLAKRDGDAVGHLMEGLMIVGIAMSFVGNSRPASGAEHHMSHFWELSFLMEGRKAIPHGIKVGIATFIINNIANKFIEMDIDFENIGDDLKILDRDKWKNEINRVYKKAAPEILSLNDGNIDDMVEDRKSRQMVIRDNWEDIVHVIREFPDADKIQMLLKRAGIPIRPQDVGIDREMVQDAILYAKELRQKYTILQLLGDMGLLKYFAYMDGLY